MCKRFSSSPLEKMRKNFHIFRKSSTNRIPILRGDCEDYSAFKDFPTDQIGCVVRYGKIVIFVTRQGSMEIFAIIIFAIIPKRNLFPSRQLKNESLCQLSFFRILVDKKAKYFSYFYEKPHKTHLLMRWDIRG